MGMKGFNFCTSSFKALSFDGEIVYSRHYFIGCEAINLDGGASFWGLWDKKLQRESEWRIKYHVKNE